jgi:hypothetical protein
VISFNIALSPGSGKIVYKLSNTTRLAMGSWKSVLDTLTRLKDMFQLMSGPSNSVGAWLGRALGEKVCVGENEIEGTADGELVGWPDGCPVG